MIEINLGPDLEQRVIEFAQKNDVSVDSILLKAIERIIEDLKHSRQK